MCDSNKYLELYGAYVDLPGDKYKKIEKEKNRSFF